MRRDPIAQRVSVLFNEPKLLKSMHPSAGSGQALRRFSALQRAEIAEIEIFLALIEWQSRFSALQRAEIAEIWHRGSCVPMRTEFQCSSTSRNC